MESRHFDRHSIYEVLVMSTQYNIYFLAKEPHEDMLLDLFECAATGTI